MVGYALAKMQFRGKNIVFGAVMVTLMVPSVATFVPLFVIIANLGLSNPYRINLTFPPTTCGSIPHPTIYDRVP